MPALSWGFWWRELRTRNRDYWSRTASDIHRISDNFLYWASINSEFALFLSLSCLAEHENHRKMSHPIVLLKSMSNGSIPLRRFHVHVFGQARWFAVWAITTTAGSFVSNEQYSPHKECLLKESSSGETWGRLLSLSMIIIMPIPSWSRYHRTCSGSHSIL